MSTEQLLVLQPVATGRNVAAGADPAGIGADPEAFLQALLQRLDGGAPAEQAGAEVAPSATPTRPATQADAEQLAALIEQLKVLAGQAAVAALAEDGKPESGNPVDAGGNILPGTDLSAVDVVASGAARTGQLAAPLIPVPPIAGSHTEAGPPTPAERARGRAEWGLPTAAVAQAYLPGMAGVDGKISSPRSDAVGGGGEDDPDSPELPVALSPDSVAPPVVAAFAVPGPAAPDLAGGAGTAVVANARLAFGPAIRATAPNPVSAAGPPVSRGPAGAVVNSDAGSPRDSVGSGEGGLAPSADVSGASTPGARQVSFSGSGNGSDAIVPVAEPAAFRANAANVAGPDGLAAHARAMGSASGGPAAGVGFSLPPDLLRAVAAELSKSGGGAQSPTQVVEGLEPVPPMAAAAQAAHATATPQPTLPQFASATELQRPESPVVKTFLGEPGWSDDLGQRVVWMAGKGVQTAELQLHPQHLGPLEVRISMTQDQASVQFVAHHAGVREAIEAAIPKLREMLGAQNLNLADISVTQHSFSEHRDPRGAQLAYDQQSQSGRQGQPSTPEPAAAAGLGTQVDCEQPVGRRSGRGLLSLYA